MTYLPLIIHTQSSETNYNKSDQKFLERKFGVTPLLMEYPVGITILYEKDKEGSYRDVYKMRDTLVERGHMVRLYEVTKKNWRQMAKVPGDIFMNLVESSGYELYMKVGSSLAMTGRVQMGLDMKSLKWCINKQQIKEMLVTAGIKTPKYRIVSWRNRHKQIRGLEYPLFVKPAGEHASEGITQDSVVIDEKELKERVEYLLSKYGGKVLVEEYVEGEEVHVAVLGNGSHLTVLPPVRLKFGKDFNDMWNVFSYQGKWVDSSWEYWQTNLECPVSFGREVDKKIDDISKKAFKALGCKDIVRFDLRIDLKGRVFVIDVNLSPSISDNLNDECFLSVHRLGWTYAQFLETILSITYKRAFGRMPDRVRERQWLLPPKFGVL